MLMFAPSFEQPWICHCKQYKYQDISYRPRISFLDQELKMFLSGPASNIFHKYRNSLLTLLSYPEVLTWMYIHLSRPRNPNSVNRYSHQRIHRPNHSYFESQMKLLPYEVTKKSKSATKKSRGTFRRTIYRLALDLSIGSNSGFSKPGVTTLKTLLH